MKEELIKNFAIPGNLVKIQPITAGNIHKTYVATYLEEGKERQYLMQQINQYVFKNPYEVMDNIEGITKHLQKELEKNGDKAHQVLQVIQTKDGHNMYVCQNKAGDTEFYRVYNFIQHSISYDTTQNPEIVHSVGKAFGNFQKLLKEYPIETLAETIKDFHHTKNRYTNWEQNVEKDRANRVKTVKPEIDFIRARKEVCSLLVDKLKNKEIPYRVTHNDTKVNNVMLDEQTKDFLAVIDLDTVMPGSGLYDYGDGIRSATSNAAEDEVDLSKVYLRMDLFECYTDGYLSELAPYLVAEEVRLMGEAIRLLTLELGMRFLEDYINGDLYFKCDYATHNLDRARNQLKLVEDIESKMEGINKYIQKSYEKYCKLGVSKK